MIKKFLLYFSLLLGSSPLCAQTYLIRGVVTDEATGETLIGATVISGDAGVTTEYDGSYELKLEKGRHTVVYSYVGYTPVEKEVTLESNMVLDVMLGSVVLSEVVVTADIAIERRTPVAFSNIPTLKIKEELSGQELPMILNSTPGAYATQSGGGDGDARITLRGFNQRNIAVMLDGVPVNDMENGQVYWSNWFGLDLVTQTMQVQRGLGASKLSLPSVGGTINILTKGIDSKKNYRFEQEIGNNGYLRSTFGINTGRLKNGWGVSLAGSYKQGDGWVDGNYTKGWFYYLRVDKELGKHLISLQGFGAPQEHGQRPFTAEIATVDEDLARELGVSEEVLSRYIVKDQGRRYSEFWGYKDGEVFNTRINYYHKPQFSLRHSWQVTPQTYWSNVAYLSVGDGGGTSPVGASIPFDSTGQLFVDKAVERNQPTIFNPRGLSNTIIQSSVNNHFWYGFLSTLQHRLNERLTLSGGIDGRYYRGDHWREVYDLLGGTGYRSDSLQVGDKFDYHYSGFVRWLGAFGLAEYATEKWSLFVNISAAHTAYKAEDFFRNQALDWEGLFSTTIKLGAAYNPNARNSFFVNTGYLNRAQRFTNVINVNRFGDSLLVFKNFENEKIRAVELGYSFKSPVFSMTVNGYYTNWLSKPLDTPPTVALPNPDGSIDDDSERVPVNIPGIDALHAGVELDFSFQPFRKLAFEGLLSLGDWRWNSGGTAEVVLREDFSYRYDFDATGVHVGDAAQTQIGALIRYEPVKGLYFRFKGTYFGRHWSDFQPEDLRPSTSTAGKDSWQLPDYTLFDFHTGYGFKIAASRIDLRLNVLNVFDKVFLSDGRNNDSFNSPAFSDFDAKSASVFFGQGRRWTASASISF